MSKNENNLKHYRKQANLTQAQLAQLVGTTQSSLSRLESGEVENIQVKTLSRFCSALEINASIAVDGSLTFTKQKYTPISHLTKNN